MRLRRRTTGSPLQTHGPARKRDNAISEREMNTEKWARMTDTVGETTDELAQIDSLANAALTLWPLPGDARAKRINVSENVTYLVQSSAGKAILRIHRVGYHTDRAISCELAWSAALRSEGVIRTPAWRLGRNGEAIQTIGHDRLAPRQMVMFDFVAGEAPSEDQNLAPAFQELGAIAAQTHLHSLRWVKPRPFERLRWDLDTVFGDAATWGDWRRGPGVDAAIRSVLEAAESEVIRCLTIYGHEPDRFGLIHADMRLANLILGPEGPVVIDFDDCGFGWFLFDFASAISFMEDSPQISTLKDAWLQGYQTIRPLGSVDVAAIDALVMLRRMSLLAWIGSHIDAPEPQALAPDFAANTASLAEVFLSHKK